MIAERLRSEALSLPPPERATLIDDLLASLDQADPAIDALWLEECRQRFVAHEAGAMESIDADEVFAELERS